MTKKAGNGLGFGAPGPGFEIINKFGENIDIDTATTPETIWAHGGVFPFLDAGITMDVFSSSALDTLAGTGAQKIRITFYDGLNVEFIQDFDMEGVTKIQLPGVVKLVSRIEVTQAGSGSTNAGEINAVDRATGLVVYQSLEIGDGQTKSCVQMVPAGKRGLVKKINCTYAKSTNRNDAELDFNVRLNNGTILKKHYSDISSASPKNGRDYGKGGVKMSAGDICFWECVSVSANDTPIFASFDIEMEDT